MFRDKILKEYQNKLENCCNSSEIRVYTWIEIVLGDKDIDLYYVIFLTKSRMKRLKDDELKKGTDNQKKYTLLQNFVEQLKAFHECSHCSGWFPRNTFVKVERFAFCQSCLAIDEP